MRSLVPALGTFLTVLAFAVHAHAQEVVVFDTMTGLDEDIRGNYKFTTGTPRNYIGQSFQTDPPGGTAEPITAIEFFVGYTGADVPRSFTDVHARVQFWDTYTNPAGNPGTNLVFSDPLNSTFDFDLGPIAFISTEAGAFPIRRFKLSLPTPVFSADTFGGIAFNITGTPTDGGSVDANTLVVALRGGTITNAQGQTVDSPAFAVGSVPLNGPNYGYFRNASNRTDFNFQSNDARNIGVNSAVALRLYTGVAVVPEASTLGLIGPGILLMTGVIVRRRRVA